MVANLTITKTAAVSGGGGSAQAGDTITYTITVVNTGDMDATNALLTDLIDANTTLTANTLDITPIARNDGFAGDEDTVLSVDAASGVLGNDDDLDGGAPVQVTAVAGGSVGVATATTAGGSVTMAADGSFDYTPPTDFSGTDTFEYTVIDDEGDTDTAIVTIEVAAGNTGPVITSDGGGATAAVSIDENTTLATDVQTDDDLDAEGTGLTYSITGGDDLDFFSIDAATGELRFIAPPDFENPLDGGTNPTDNDYEVQVTVTDSGLLTDTQDITVTVNDAVENTAPVITSDGGGATAAVSIDENTTLATDVQTDDDLDAEGTGLTYSITGGDDLDFFSIDAATGALRFIAPPDFENPLDGGTNPTDNDYEVQVTVTDSGLLTDTQDITVTVTDALENTAPVITSDGGGATATVSIDENTTLVTDVETNDDLDVEGAGLTYSITGGDDQAFFSIDAATGELSFIAPPDFENPLDGGTNPTDNDYEVQVTVTDSGLLTDTQDITISVTDVVENTAPTAQDQTYSTFGNTVLEVAGADIPGNEATSVTSTVSLLTGATDPDAGDTLSVQAGTFATTEGGSVTTFSDGSFYYTPDAGDVSVADTFTFTVLDGNGGSDTATATVNVSSDRIWYVDDDAGAGGDGTSANPFTSLTPLNTGGSSDGLDGNGDIIYVLAGTYTGGITLENNQSLLGQAVDLVVDGTTLISGSNANRPSLASPSANAINLASGNTVRGLDITGATTQNGIVGSDVGDTLIDNVTFTGLDLEAVQLTNTSSNATITLQNNTVNSPNSTTGVELEVLNLGNATNITVNVINNTLSNVSNSAILVENIGNGTLNTTVSGNNVTVDNAGSFTIEVEQVNNGTTNALIDNNNVFGQLNDTDAFFVNANNGAGTLNATVTNNSNDTAPLGPIGSGLFGQVQNDSTLNLNASSNSFVGLNDEDIALVNLAIMGANPTLNVTQTSGSNLSAVNNNAGLFTDGTINFGAGTPPLPLLAASAPLSTTTAELTNTELAFVVDAAINRWAATGLSDDQVNLLESINFEVTDLPDWYIGAATGTTIQLDTNAFGWGWFVDTTPLEDSEFSEVVAAYAFQADTNSSATGQIDLLTAVMHEMGHTLGLVDLRGVDQLMNGTIPAGTRRLPTFGLANGVMPDDNAATEYIGAPVNLGTLNEDQVVTLTFEVTVNDPIPTGVTQLINEATVTADGGISEMATATTAVTALPQVSIVATDAAAGEDPLDTATYTVSRTNTTDALDVLLDLGFGTGLTAADFTLTGGNIVINGTTATVTIPDGDSSIDITLTPDEDPIAEDLETLTLSIAADAAYTIDGTASSAAATITDDDVATLALFINPDTISENGGTANLEVVRNTDTTGDLVVDLSSDDNSEIDLEFSQVTIAAGNASTNVLVTGVDDAILDGTQTVTITAMATGLADGTTTVDVTDDDAPTTTLRIEGEDINDVMGYRLEGNGAASGGQMLSLLGFGGPETGTATFLFTGATGLYDVDLGTFDESDGTASFTVEQNNVQIGSTIVLDQNTNGSGGANNSTKVTRSVGTGIQLFNGAPITVTGFEQASEHARFDFIEFTPANGGSDTPPTATDDAFTTDEAAVIDDQNVLANDSGTPPLTVVEVEGSALAVGAQITLASGALLTLNEDGSFTYDPNGAFDSLDTGESDTDSFTYLVSNTLGVSEGTATVTIDGIDDSTLGLTIVPNSISENGGMATATVSRNTTVGDLLVTLNSSDTGEATLPTSVTIEAGNTEATFTVTGIDDNVIDGTQNVTITAAAAGFNDGTADIDVTDDDAVLPTVLVEAEEINSNDITGYRIENRPIASGGSMLSLVGQSGGEVGMAAFTFNETSGNYTLVLGTFDENDGQANFVVEQNGVQVGSTIVLDQDPGGNSANAGTKVERVVATNVFVSTGDTFKITGTEVQGEHARFDFFRFDPADDVPDVAPEITTTDLVTVNENQTFVLNINATDANGDTEGSGLTYSITGGADDGSFNINANTGALSFDSPPDFEMPGDSNGDNEYVVEVTVTDSTGLTDEQTLNVTVNDVNETGGGTLIRLEAEDADTIVNYRTENIGVASGNQALSLVGVSPNETGSATFGFNDASGSYDIILGTFDEADGLASFTVELNDFETGITTEIATLDLNMSLGSNLANAQTLISPTVATGIGLTPGDTITVNGFENGSEHARLDYVELSLV